MARDTIRPLFERGVCRLLPTENNSDLLGPRVGLRLEDLVEDIEANR